MLICNFGGARLIGAPKDWDQRLDGDCVPLPVADAVDPLSGHNFMYSVWRPTAAEIEALQAGGAIRLGVAGHVHPVVNMTVLAPGTCAEAQLVEMAVL